MRSDRSYAGGGKGAHEGGAAWDRFDGVSLKFQSSTTPQTCSEKRSRFESEDDDDDELDILERRRMGERVDKIEIQRRRKELDYERCSLGTNSVVDPGSRTAKYGLATWASDQTVESASLSSTDEVPDTTAEALHDASSLRQNHNLLGGVDGGVRYSKTNPLPIENSWWESNHTSTAETRETEDTYEDTNETHETEELLEIKESEYTEAKQMRAVYRAFGGISTDHIKVEEGEIVVPAARDHVVVKITASTITLHDCLLRRGLDFQVTDPVSLPAVPGHDFVGMVVACGDQVETFGIGDIVAGMVRTGGNARLISVPEKSLVGAPPNADPAEVACMVSVYATAYQCLKMVSCNKLIFSMTGKNVVIVGGIDGVGEALVELCKKAKAQVFFTAPERRHNYVRSTLGVTPLPDDPVKWLRIVESCIDYVFDGVCQNGLSTSLKALNPNGKLVCFGREYLLRQKMGLFGAPISAHLEVFVQTSFYGKAQFLDLWEFYKKEPETYKRNLLALFEMLRWKKLKPHIAKKVSLDEVGASHHKLEAGEVRGTLVCFPWKRVSRNQMVRVGVVNDDPARSFVGTVP